jgi:hypothetical protein
MVGTSEETKEIDMIAKWKQKNSEIISILNHEIIIRCDTDSLL